MPVEQAASFILENPEWGWVIALGFGFEQLFAPWETRLDKLVARIEERIEEMEQGQKAHMTVTRALVRTDPDIDTEAVDEYLVENGAEPEDFIVEDRPRRPREGGEEHGAD